MPKYERPPSPPRGERIVLLSWQNAPPHARYPHVPTGYRPGCPASQSSLLGSLFSWHNESANAWSHLLGVVYAATRMHAVATSSASMEARLSVCIFLASAVFCFSASTLAHSLAPVLPREQAARLWSYDLLGICVLIGGSYVPGLRWSFRCRPAHQLAYTAIVAAALLCGAVLSRAPPDDTRFGYRANKGFVTTVIFTAGFGLVCVAHWCTFAPASERVLLLPPVLKMFSWYGLGVVFWKSDFPERLFSGGMPLPLSHLIWHCAVFAAVVCWDDCCAALMERPWDGRDCTA